jgi:hypothetical protein
MSDFDIYDQLRGLRDLGQRDEELDLPSRSNGLLVALLQEVCCDLRNLGETDETRTQQGRDLQSLREAIKFQLNQR